MLCQLHIPCLPGGAVHLGYVAISQIFSKHFQPHTYAHLNKEKMRSKISTNVIRSHFLAPFRGIYHNLLMLQLFENHHSYYHHALSTIACSVRSQTRIKRSTYSQSQTSPITSPSVQREHLASPKLLLAEVFCHAAFDLCQG